MVNRTVLNKISRWDNNNPHTLIKLIREIWQYPCVELEAGEQIISLSLSKTGWITIHLRTFHLADNESIIEALKKSAFWGNCWTGSTKKGDHYFDLQPRKYGFRLRSEYTTDTGVSKVMIYRHHDRYDWFEISPYKRFLRPKSHESKAS